MANEMDDEVRITRAQGGRTVLRRTKLRSCEVGSSRGPFPNTFDKTEQVVVVSEIVRGGDDDRVR